MSEDRTIKVVRAINYVAGTIKHHAGEPLCADCKSYSAVVESVRELISHFNEKVSPEAVPQMFRPMFDEAQTIIRDAKVTDEPIPRRKTGECALPDKRCFLKNSRKFFNECMEH